jgi:hypothetical protein
MANIVALIALLSVARVSMRLDRMTSTRGG